MPTRISSSRLVGRDEQVAKLVEAAEAVVAEAEPRVVFVGGEAGVGKTRLLMELVAHPSLSRSRLSLGHCVEISQGDLPFAPIVEALRQSLQDLSVEEREKAVGPARHELSSLIPELAGDEVMDRSASTAGFGQGRFFEMLLGVLDRLGGSPATLVVEDLHWADDSTRDFLSFIARSTHHARLLVIATYRTDELHRRHPLRPFLGEIERLPTVEVVELPRLNRQYVADQISEILDSLPRVELVDRVFELSEGNPFFVEELLAATGRDDPFRERDEGGLPRTIRDALLFRLEGVSDGAQEVLRVASGAGREIPHRLLEEVAETDPRTLDQGLREAVGHHLLVSNQKQGTYAFRHALLREAVYEDLLPGEKTRLHLAFATVLDRSPELAQSSSAAVAELAYHYYEGREFPKALKASVAAGHAAMQSYAFAEARRHYERALDLWGNVPGASELAGMTHVDLTRAAAEASLGQGDPDRAIALGRDALDRVDPKADRVTSALINERLGRYLWVLGKTEEAHDAHDTAVNLLKGEPASAEHARVLAGQAQILMLSARFSESIPVAEAAIAMAREVDAKQVLGHALNSLGVCTSYRGGNEQGIDYMREALAIAGAIDEYDDVGRGYTNLCELLMIAGRHEESISEYYRALEADDRLGISRSYGVWHRTDLANALVPLGRWDEAEQVLNAIDFLPFDQLAGNMRLSRARLATGRGDFESAAESLRAAKRNLAYVLQPQSVGVMRVAEAELELWRKRPVDTREVVDTGLEELLKYEDEGFPTALCWLGLRAEADISELARAGKDDETSSESRRVAESLFETAASLDPGPEFFGPPTGPFAKGCKVTMDAEMTRVTNEPSPAKWAKAAEVWSELDDPFQSAYCKWREGEAGLLAADRKVAEDALREAYGTATHLGARPLVEEIKALAVRGRLDLGEASQGAVPQEDVRVGANGAGLTAREVEVLKLVAEGLTNSQIAEELFISRKTVSVHVSHILEKFGVSSRVEAAGMAHRLGISSTDRV